MLLVLVKEVQLKQIKLLLVKLKTEEQKLFCKNNFIQNIFRKRLDLSGRFFIFIE
jgi:hypothetical protein